MKLSEFYEKPIKEIVETMEMVDLKVHSDNAGNVRRVEIKFINQEEIEEVDGKKNKRTEQEFIF